MPSRCSWDQAHGEVQAWHAFMIFFSWFVGAYELEGGEEYHFLTADVFGVNGDNLKMFLVHFS